jgi:hypothetical protein
MSVKITNRVTPGLKRAAAESRKELRKALLELGDEKLALTQQRVPYKTGKLSGTGRKSVRAGEKQISLKISYGGPEAPYALRVHEDLEANYKGGRRAKYVESVLLETKFAQELAAKFDIRKLASA